MTLAFGLYASLRGYAAEVFVNDVPVSDCPLGMAREDSVPVTGWLMNGDNELRLVVHGSPLDLATDEPEIDAASFHRAAEAAGLVARARIVRGELGEVPDPEFRDVLGAVDAAPPPGADGGGPLVFPIVRSVWFALSDRPRWTWQAADVVDPDDAAVRAELVAFMRGMHDDLVHADVDALLTKMGPRFADAAAMGATPVEAEQAARADFGVISTHPHVVAPMSDEELEFRAFAGGRVVGVRSRVDGRSPLQSGLGAAERWLLDVWLARIDGHFAVVR